MITLGILSVVIAGGFFGIYQILFTKLEKNAEKKAYGIIQRQSARMFSHMSFVYWTDYKQSDPKNMEYLGIAITLCERALKITSNLNSEISEKVILDIKNNLAYYLATARNTSLQKKRNRKN